MILGSGELIRSLLPHGLIDRFVLLIHPLALGSGQHLFDDNEAMAKFRLLDTTTTSKGVVVATYEVKEAEAGASWGSVPTGRSGLPSAMSRCSARPDSGGECPSKLSASMPA